MSITVDEFFETDDIELTSTSTIRVRRWHAFNPDGSPLTTEEAKLAFSAEGIKLYEPHPEEEYLIIQNIFIRAISTTLVMGEAIYHYPRISLDMNLSGKILWRLNIGVTGLQLYETLDGKVIGDEESDTGGRFGTSVSVPEISLEAEMPVPTTPNPALWLSLTTKVNSSDMEIPGGSFPKGTCQYLGPDAVQLNPFNPMEWRVIHHFRARLLTIRGADDTHILDAAHIVWPLWYEHELPDDPEGRTITVPDGFDIGRIYEYADLNSLLVI